MRVKVMAELSPGPQARRFLFVLAGAAAALTLGGCELVPTAPVATAPAPPTRTAEAEPEAARPQPVQSQPAPTAPLPQGTPHRIAVLVPTTGANSGVGQSIANAANLALLDTGGGRIRLTVYDTARGAAAAAAQAIADGNRLFLGPWLAEDVRAAAPAARRAGVPVVAFSNDTSVAASGVYLMGFTPGQSVARVVDHARGTGAARFAALVPEGFTAAGRAKR
jgi:ABC-type branched-subunit amino acid transport system substrate-binding protein